MVFKRIYRHIFLATALLWLLSTSVAMAFDTVQTPNKMLVSGYQQLFNKILSEEEISASGMDTLLEEKPDERLLELHLCSVLQRRGYHIR